jgi:hypothetical protein
MTTTGFFDSGDGGLGVVAVGAVVVGVVAVVVADPEASVAPAEGASVTPGAFELPQAARPRASISPIEIASDFRLIEGGRVATSMKNRC